MVSAREAGLGKSLENKLFLNGAEDEINKKAIIPIAARATSKPRI